MGISSSVIMKHNEDINALSSDNIEINNTKFNARIHPDEMEGEIPNEEIKYFSFDELIAQIKSNLDLYKKNNDLIHLQKAIEVFGEIPKTSESLTNDIVKNSEDLKNLFETIKLCCYSLDSESNKNYYVQMFAEKIFLGWKYDKNIVYYKDTFLISGLVNYNKDKLSNIQSRLDYLEYVTNYYIEYGDPYPEHETIPEISLPETPLPEVPLPDKDENNGNSGENNSSDSNNNNINNDNSDVSKPNINIDNIYNSVIKFEESGGKCYKVEETYNNGIKVASKKILANKSDYVQCSIYDYVNFGSNIVSPVVEVDKEYIQNNQNTNSDYYIYYTITKTDKTPYYFNSGIRARIEDMTISYNQLSDVLYQIAIKKEAFNVKSNTKSLFVINGKPIVLNKNKQSDYTNTDIENILNNYPDLGVKIMEDKEFKVMLNNYNEENLERNYIENIIIDGNDIKADDIAWIDKESEIIKTSIEMLSQKLGANTKSIDDTLIITKDGIEIILKNNSEDYYVNGNISSFLDKTYTHKGILISEIADIPKRLGYNVEFDLDKNMLEFKKIN